MSRRAAFAFFGAKPRTRSSWSAIAEDGTPIFTRWQHEIGENDSMHWFVRSRTDRFGYREMIANLIYARDHCGGRFKIVTIVAKDPGAPPGERRITNAWPEPDLVMIRKNESKDLSKTCGDTLGEIGNGRLG